MRRLARPLRRSLLLACALLAASCGSDVGPTGRLVGGPCRTDADCVKRCGLSNAFPGGMCTLACTGDVDCPNGTACVDLLGGVCAIGCTAITSCSEIGVGWGCDDADRKGAPGKVQVCKKP